MTTGILQSVPTDRIVDGDRRIYPREAAGIEMGEVLVRVKITNAADESLVHRGEKPAESVRSVEVEALVDTGAVECVLPAKIADQLGLARLYTKKAAFADGRSEQIPVAEPVFFEILGRKVSEDCFVVGNAVLIGQTALEKTDLFVDRKRRQVVGNPAHPGQAIIRMF